MFQTCHSCEVPKGPNAGIHQIYNFYSHAVKWIPELRALRPFGPRMTRVDYLRQICPLLISNSRFLRRYDEKNTLLYYNTDLLCQ